MHTMLLLLQAIAAAAADDPRGPGAADVDFASFEVSGLRCLIGNNTSTGDHRPGYNGLFALTAPGLADSVYVPAYAGLNLEHYFDARQRSEDPAEFFEPRYASMTFRRIDARTAELHQPPTPLYGVESWTRFTLEEPHYIDVEFRCVPRQIEFAGGWFGVFWASYMNGPANKSIYFLAEGSTLDAPRWLQFCTQQHNHASTVRPAGDALDLPMPDSADTLFNSFSPLRYGEPFYYGLIGDHVLIYIFEPNPGLRFAHSPSGGGPTADGTDTNPAWDFQLIVPEPEAGREYVLRWRTVLKPFAGRDDVLDEVRAYRRARD